MTPIFVVFKKMYCHSIVVTLIHLDGGDDWGNHLIIPFIGGIMVPHLTSCFVWTSSWLVGIFKVYIKTCRE